MVLEVGVSSDEKIGEEQARVQFAQACGTPAALFSLQRGGQDHRSNIEDFLPPQPTGLEGDDVPARHVSRFIE